MTVLTLGGVLALVANFNKPRREELCVMLSNIENIDIVHSGDTTADLVHTISHNWRDMKDDIRAAVSRCCVYTD